MRSAITSRPGGLGSLLLHSLLLGGCVYPATDPTGVELSWRFVEHNEVDGEQAARARTCVGTGTEQLAVEIADLDDPRRFGTFRFDCATGYQSAIDLQIEASDAFVRLDPGAYRLRMHAVDDASNAPDDERLEEREVDVADDRVTVQTWILRRAPVTWALELRGAGDCDAVAMTLRYASPETDLADYAEPEDQAPPAYRVGLGGDRELGLGGEAVACAPQLDGVHRFEGIDRGEYQLQVDVDDRTCTVLVDLRASQDTSSVIDLANLPCGG